MVLAPADKAWSWFQQTRVKKRSTEEAREKELKAATRKAQLHDLKTIQAKAYQEALETSPNAP